MLAGGESAGENVLPGASRRFVLRINPGDRGELAGAKRPNLLAVLSARVPASQCALERLAVGPDLDLKTILPLSAPGQEQDQDLRKCGVMNVSWRHSP